MIDTIKIRVVISKIVREYLEKWCTVRQGINLRNGTLIYQIVVGELTGSFDSRLGFRFYQRYNEWGQILEYIEVNCSVHKLLLGHNCYGGTNDLQLCCQWLVGFIKNETAMYDDITGEKSIFVDIPDWYQWELCGIHNAICFDLGSYEAVEYWLKCHQAAEYARRKPVKYGLTGICARGSETTIKVYHKGVEFQAHGDYEKMLKMEFIHSQIWSKHMELEERYESQKLKRNLLPVEGDKNMTFLYNGQLVSYDKLPIKVVPKSYKMFSKATKILQKAYNLLRLEVEVKAPKIKKVYGCYPLIDEVDYNDILDIYNKEVFKFLKEGLTEMKTVREANEVKKRLYETYSKRVASNLISTWSELSIYGEENVKQSLSKATFYRHVFKLKAAGISWHGTNLVMKENSLVPADFVPMIGDCREVQGEDMELLKKLLNLKIA